ncbi:MAG: 2-C-methyl-D-erythritol 2,4-cyclodiphosphate synthase [Nitrospinae bacterium]|nr:2-C-methyl-D-erythritol 2,4-cyclodiphosphate synthase [Nitrospinota bacterium]
MRIGIGFDAHRFVDGDGVVIGGIKIPFDKALLGHSDADVLLHAISDAILGALALGDIGKYFPPSDPQFKGMQSIVILKKAVMLIVGKGYLVNNVDCVIIAEEPKIAPHADAMRKVIAEACGVPIGAVSVKATTTELMGFTGRKEGIAAQAVALLRQNPDHQRGAVDE